MVAADKVVLLSAFCIHVVLCLPVLRESPEISRQARSAVQQYPVLGRLSQGSPLLNQWDLTTLGDEDDYPNNYVRSRPDVQHARRFMDNPIRPRLESRHTHRRTLDYPMTKRDEEANIPTMGLGVLSDMRKFFNDLRVNLDSVEEAAALSQDQGNFSRAIDPADFLAFLARHGARNGEATSGEAAELTQNPNHMRRLMFGYNHDDQPYAHSGLGK